MSQDTKTPLPIPSSVPDSSFVKVIPFFVSYDVLRSHAFYNDVLGWRSVLAPPPDSASFMSISRGEGACVNIYVRRQDEKNTLPVGRCMVMLSALEELRKWRGELADRGLEERNGEEAKEIGQGGGKAWMGPVEDMEWGYRQFDLWDPDGNLIVPFAFLNES